MKLIVQFFNTILGVLLSFFFLNFDQNLYGQNYFGSGIFGYDEPFPGHPLNANEQGLLLDSHANFIYGLIDTSLVDDFIAFCNTNNLKTCIENDPTSVPGSGPFYPYPGKNDNTSLYKYICRNEVSAIDCTLIRQLINNIHTTYPSEPGLGAILVAHQGRTYGADHWPYIQYACSLIHANYGNNVRSLVIDNASDWTLANLENFFRTIDSLDCFQHEFYPFHVGGQPSYPPTDSTIFNTDAFQINLIDNQLIDSYNLVRQALVNSGNKYTRWEVIYQAHREWDGSSAHFWRRPTQAELWLQAFLALSRGAKGAYAYVYRSYNDASLRSFGLVDNSTTRQKINTPVYNRPYENVAQLNEHLAAVGAAILDDTVHIAFTWTGTAYKYLKNITGDSTDGPSPPNSHRTIEVCIFKPRQNNNSYERFLLINRRCNRNSSGVWVNAFPQNIDVTLADSMPSGTYQIRDLYSNEHYISSDKIFRQIKILAGRGRVFELKRLFVNATDTLANTVNICSNITVPSGKTLVIQPNSTVKFYSGKYLLVQGKLTANGSASQHIKFTSAATTPARGNWEYIKIDNYASASYLNYCDIEYAKTGIWVYGGNANPTIQNCEIKECSQYGVRIENNGTNKTTFKHNNVHHNSVYGVFLMTTSAPTMLNITATNNGHSGLVCYNSSPKIGSVETGEAAQNKFLKNSQHGIWCTGSSGSSPVIYRNTKINPSGGYVRLDSNAVNGLRADNGSQPHLGESSSSPGYNSICDNGSV